MIDKSDKNRLFSAEALMRLQPVLPPAPAPVHLPKHLTYAAVIDVRDAETEITDLMVKRACKEAESLQQFPFGPRKSSA